MLERQARRRKMTWMHPRHSQTGTRKGSQALTSMGLHAVTSSRLLARWRNPQWRRVLAVAQRWLLLFGLRRASRRPAPLAMQGRSGSHRLRSQRLLAQSFARSAGRKSKCFVLNCMPSLQARGSATLAMFVSCNCIEHSALGLRPSFAI